MFFLVALKFCVCKEKINSFSNRKFRSMNINSTLQKLNLVRASVVTNTILKILSVNPSTQRRNRSTLIGRDFLTLRDFNETEVKDLLSTAADLKKKVLEENKVFEICKGKNLALIFEKKSTRTRLSMETAMSTLGGYPIFLSPTDIHLGEGESVVDTARVMSKMVSSIFARVYEHSMLETLSKEATVPIINGLSELYHPLQSLADFLTLYEHYKSIEGLTLTWVGDGNNIIHSIMMAAPKLGVNLRIATPEGYEVYPQVKEDTDKLCKQFNTSVEYTTDPYHACKGTNVIVTDTWVSMGQEEEYKKRIRDFDGYQVTRKMTDLAAEDWCFLHCLPRKPHEVDDGTFYSDRSLVWEEAGNRKWTAMAVLARLLTDFEPETSFIE